MTRDYDRLLSLVLDVATVLEEAQVGMDDIELIERADRALMALYEEALPHKHAIALLVRGQFRLGPDVG